METKDILRSLREKNKLTQDQMAERLMVTRQAVSRWDGSCPKNSMFRSTRSSAPRGS